MNNQNVKAFRKGMSKLGCTQIEFYENGIRFEYQGEVRKETYQQCMVYILNGLA